MRTGLYIAVAGAAGAVCRHLVGLGMLRLFGGRLPYGTFAVNLVGSFIMGFLVTLFAFRGQSDSQLRIALTVGFLGSFTTYSSFALETVTLVQNRQGTIATAYVGITLSAAAAACLGGMAFARWLQ